MGKDGQSSKSGKPAKSPKKKSASSKKPNSTPVTGTSKNSKATGSKAVNSKVASAKGGATKSSKASSGGGSSSYSQSKSAPSSKVSKGTKSTKQRYPGNRKPAAPSTAVKGQKKSPKSVKSGKKSTAASSSSSAYSSATSDDSTAEVKNKAKNKRDEQEEGGTENGTAEDKASTTSYETEEEGEEVESKVVKNKHKEKPPPAEKPLEFTKPTINQMKKEKKEKPLSMAERITSREFEQLFDDVNELNSGVGMLKHSYASIIKSLVAIQTRRGKKKSAKEVQKKVAEATGGKVTFLTTLSTCNPNELRTKSCLENNDKYDIENFLNPGTRDETFQLLFDEIDDLTKRFEPMRPFYDDRGRFRRDTYDAQEDVKMDRTMYNEFKIWCKKLSDIVDDIARNYNDDLLNMFRLN